MTLNYNQSHMCDDRVGMRGGLLAQSQIIVSSEPNNIICVDTSGSCTTGCKVVQRRSRSLRSMMGASQLPPNLPNGINANAVWVSRGPTDSKVGEQCQQTFERQGFCVVQQNPRGPPTRRPYPIGAVPTPRPRPTPRSYPTPPPRATGVVPARKLVQMDKEMEAPADNKGKDTA